jgi:hypothetical protein
LTLAGQNQHNTQEELNAMLAISGTTVVAGLWNGVDPGSVEVFKGRIASESPLIGQVGGGVKARTIRGTDIRIVTVYFDAPFERLLVRPQGVKVTFKVRESSHGKVTASGTATVIFTAEYR